jgi:hypothetical protein
MEQTGGFVAVVVYLAILAFAVAWFLLPRWLKQRREASQRKGPDVSGAAPASDLD